MTFESKSEGRELLLFPLRIAVEGMRRGIMRICIILPYNLNDKHYN